MTTGLCLFACGLVLGAAASSMFYLMCARISFRRKHERADADLAYVRGLVARDTTPNGDIVLDFLTDLTVGMAQRLTLRRHGNLYLNGLSAISDETARALTHAEKFQRLDEFGTDDPNIRLQPIEDERISCDDHPVPLVDETAERFMSDDQGTDEDWCTAELETPADRARPNNTLFLDGLTTLSPNAAIALAKHGGDLSLNGLDSLSPEVAKALAQHRGAGPENQDCSEEATSDWKPRSRLWLNGLKMLSEPAARALAAYRGDLFLDGLTSLSQGAARALSQHESRLSLNGVTQVSAHAAAALAEHKGDVILNRLSTFLPDVASAFAQHQGNLYLDGVIRLPDESAEAMVRGDRSNGLYLRSLVLVSDEALALLRASPNVRLPMARQRSNGRG